MNGTRLNENWSPDQTLWQWAKTRRPDLDIAETLEQFKDYWCAESGKHATKLDWGRTWRNWVRRAYALPQAPRTPSPACHAPAIREPRKTLSDEDCATNQRRLAELMGNMR